VVIGVEENAHRNFSQCPHPNVSANWLVHRVQDQTHPPVACHGIDLTTLLSDFLGIRGPQLYALAIEKKRCASGHTNAKGISKVRVGKECRTQFRADDDRTNAVVPGVSLADLSLESIHWAMSQQRRTFTLTEALPDPWDFLATAQLILENDNPGSDEDRYSVTLAALILFGKQATLRRDLPYCQTIMKTPQASTQISKNVVEMSRELVATDQAQLHQLCPFPSECLRELLVNAYMHRCWRTSGPVVITLTEDSIEIENPGDLMPSLHVGNLIYCVPVYRNFRLADGLRFIGLCDKIGQGVDIVFKSLVCGGFDFPTFESANNRFLVCLTRGRSPEFREFIQKRGASLPYLDELVLLRFLWERDEASVEHLAIALQRGKDITQRCVSGMVKKAMVEQGGNLRYKLADSVRRDIQTIFTQDQLGLFEPRA
jgi:predicted HTH transcriptional regulator